MTAHKLQAEAKTVTVTVTVATKDMPTCIQALLRNDHVEVRITDNVSVHQSDLEWSGGTRYQFLLVELAASTIVPITKGGSFVLPAGFVVVKTGVFCGKPAAGCVYANANDVTAALPKPTPILPHYLQQTLKAIACYNSNGKARHREDVGIGKQAWEQFVLELVKLGLCNKNGSLTVDGKNAAHNIDSMIINPYSDKFKG